MRYKIYALWTMYFASTEVFNSLNDAQCYCHRMITYFVIHFSVPHWNLRLNFLNDGLHLCTNTLHLSLPIVV